MDTRRSPFKLVLKPDSKLRETSDIVSIIGVPGKLPVGFTTGPKASLSNQKVY